jgi:hypothetical protein
MAKNKFLSIMLVAFTIVALPSCKWFSQSKEDGQCKSCPGSSETVEHKDGSAAIITVEGKPVLTAKEFEDFINKAAEGNEQVKLWMQFVPDFKEQVFNAKKRSVIIGEWAKKQGIRNSKEYRDKERILMDSIRENLDSEEFIKRHDVEVNDEEANKYYEENKAQDPRIITSPEGVKAFGISLKNQAEANEVAEAAKKNHSNLEKLAKDKKLSVTQFGVVNEESVIDNKIKEKILSTKTFPAVLVVKDEKGKFWVVIAKSKEKAQFRPFEQVKDLIKKLLKPKKLEEMLEKELPKLEKEYNVVSDKSYFEEQRKKSENDAQEAMKALAQTSKSETSEKKAGEPVAPKGV